MKAFVMALSACVFVLAQSCAKSDDSSSSATTFKGLVYSTLGVSDLTVSDTEISGTGTIIFEQPLGGVSEGAHFSIEFLLSEVGEARLVTFAKNDLTGGLEFALGRAGEAFDGRMITADGSTDISSALAGMNVSEALSLQMDVHNDETPAHVLVWSGEETGFGEDAALFNSEGDGDAPGNGEGVYWGVILDNATLVGAATEAPKFEEE